MVKVIRIAEGFPVEWYRLDGIVVMRSDWIGYYDKFNNTIYLTKEATWKVFIHELGHRIANIFEKHFYGCLFPLTYFIDIVLIDKYPRWMENEKVW